MRGAVDVGAMPLIDALSKVGVIVDHTGGTASAAGAAVTKSAIRKAADKWLSEPSLQKTYDQLVARLRASGRRFVVFVDDIDRLTSIEIRSLMQMVKTVGRLPNVSYCLSYDRHIVWTALAELAPGDGTRSGFAEKIVQHEVEVPVPSRSGLTRMLNASLSDLPEPPASGIRWTEMMQAGIERWIRHPRDVVRLSNAMHFAWAALRDEVDPYDVLCMEALRLFDREVFDWIRDNRSVLLGEGFSYPSAEDKKDGNSVELGRKLSENARADVVPVLRLLFPNKTDMFGSKGLSSERWSDVVARRGVATPAGYTAYFSLAPSPAAVPKRMVDEAAVGGTAEHRHVELIEAAIALEDESGGSLVGQYFQELGHRLQRMPRTALPSLLAALIDRSVRVFEVDQAAGWLGPASSHHALVGEVLARLGPSEAAENLDRIFEKSDNVGALAAIYVDVGRSIGAIPSHGADHRHYIPAERFAGLGAKLGPKILAAAEAGTLTSLPHYYEVGRAWAHIFGAEGPREWLAREATRSEHTLAKLSRGLLGMSYDGEKVRFSLLSGIEKELYDLDAIRVGCDLFADSSHVNETERDRIAALREGLQKMRSIDGSAEAAVQS